MSDARNINSSGLAPPSPPMSTQDQIASDAEMCRRLCLNLRPRSTRSKATTKQVATTGDMDWETEYALHDALRGVEVTPDDDNDEDY